MTPHVEQIFIRIETILDRGAEYAGQNREEMAGLTEQLADLIAGGADVDELRLECINERSQQIRNTKPDATKMRLGRMNDNSGAARAALRNFVEQATWALGPQGHRPIAREMALNNMRLLKCVDVLDAADELMQLDPYENCAACDEDLVTLAHMIALIRRDVAL